MGHPLVGYLLLRAHLKQLVSLACQPLICKLPQKMQADTYTIVVPTLGI